MTLETANREQVGRALDLARDGLRPFVERHLRRTRGGLGQIPALLRDTPYAEKADPLSDIAVIVIVVRAAWEELRSEIKRSIRSDFRNGIEEIKRVRDAWAHQESFSDEDTERALDTVRRLLRTIGARESEREQAQRMWEEFRARDSANGAVAGPVAPPASAPEPEPAPVPPPASTEAQVHDDEEFQRVLARRIDSLHQQIAEKRAEREQLNGRARRLEAEQQRIAGEIAGITAERESVEAAIQRLEGDLRRTEEAHPSFAEAAPAAGETPASVAEPEAPVLAAPDSGSDGAPQSGTSRASADLVHGILVEAGRPLHYREIHKRYEEVKHRDPRPPRSRSGNPANALATRYRHDPRFENVGRGMYALRGAQAAPSPTPPRQRGRSRSRYTSARPVAYTLFGVRHEVRTFRDVLLGVCATLHERSPAEFERVLELRGRVRPYFSRNPDDLHEAVQVGRSGIFAELNLSAINIVERCREVVELCGFDPREFGVETR